METFTESLDLFFQWLVRTSIHSAVIVLLILLIQKIFRRKLSAGASFLLWAVLLLRLALPWAPATKFSLFNLIPQGNDVEEIAFEESYINEAGGANEVEVLPRLNQGDESTIALAENSEQSSSGFDFSKFTKPLYCIWFLGVMVLLVNVLVANFRLWRVIKKKRPLINKDVLDLLEDCKEQMSVQTIVGVIETDRIKTPALFGFIRPRLLLPIGLVDSVDREDLRHIFLHELAHLKRMDILFSWAMIFLNVIHWFNPFIWLAFHRIRADRELACDELALSKLNNHKPEQYGGTIVKMLEQYSQPQVIPGITGILENKSQLRRRIKMIVQFNNKSLRFSVFALVLILAFGAVALTNAKTLPQSQPQANPEKLARQFLDNLLNEKYSDATENFSSEMSKSLAGDKLKMTWKQLLSNAGPFEKIIGVRTEKFLASDIILITCKFEKGPLDLKAVYDENKKMSGLWFVPTPQSVLEKYKKTAGRDIAITSFKLTPYEEGSLFNMVVGIENQGSEECKKFPVHFFYKGRKKTHSAGPLKSAQEWNERTMPFSLADGRNILMVSLDPANKIAEANEKNNQAILKVEIQDGQIVRQEYQVVDKLPEMKPSARVSHRSRARSNSAPIVLQTTPVAFANDVKAGNQTISVTFDQTMMNGSWSWCGGGDSFPEFKGKPKYDNARTTCSVPVKLKPGTVYWVGINSPSNKNFKTPHRVPAVRYAILFATAGRDGKPTPIPTDLLERAKQINDYTARLRKSNGVKKDNRKSTKNGKITTLSHDDGKSAGKWSINGSAHGVRFDSPFDNAKLIGIRIYGSRYGTRRPPAENFHVYLCDKDRKIIKDFQFPYKSFQRGQTKWVNLPVKSTELPDEFYLVASFNPHRTKGVYVHHDKQATGNSFTGLPENNFKKYNRGDWMIRAMVKK